MHFVRIGVASCFFVGSASALLAAPQEGGAPKPAPAQVGDAEFQRRVDEAVDRRLHQLQNGSADASKSSPSQAGDGSIGAQVEKMMNQKLPFELHSSAYLWQYQPLMSGAKSDTSLYFANLTVDGKDGDFGYHFEPRFRDTKLRPFFTSNVWVQEVYGDWTLPHDLGTLKAGKEYTRFGHFWDDCFFGNQPYFDGLKLDPELGLSLENSRKIDDRVMLEYAFQFFPEDGRTNGSLQDRDTISVPGARRRNLIVARLAPKFALRDDTSLQVGVSGEQFSADFAPPQRDDTVDRLAFDADLAVGPFDVFGEYTRQWGRSVVDFPIVGDPSNDVTYYWSGVEYHWKEPDLVFRFAYSMADYRNSGTNGVRETTWLPGVTWTINKHAALLVEYDAWRRHQPGGDVSLDRSLNFILYVHF